MSNFTSDLEKQFSKLGKDIQQFVEKVAPQPAGDGNFLPACDIIVSAEHYKIVADLPGLDKKAVNITLKDRIVTISGDRELNLGEEESLKKNERKQGSFSRSFALPENTEESSISASFKNGVLTVTLSKTESEEDDNARSIPIR